MKVPKVNSWLVKSCNGVSEHKESIFLCMIRRIARATSMEQLKIAEDTLKHSDFWKEKSNEKFRNCFEKTWMKESKVGKKVLTLN